VAGFYPAAAVEDGELLVLRVAPPSLKFGPPPGYQCVGDAMQVLPPKAPPAKAYKAPLAPNFDKDFGQPGGAAAEPEPDKAAKGSAKKKAKRDSTAEPAKAAPVAAPAAPAAAAAAAVPVTAEELDLSGFGSSLELEELGLDRLKAALMFLGVKCGGSLSQRADRLFSLKGVPKDQIDPSLRAPPAKNQKK